MIIFIGWGAILGTVAVKEFTKDQKAAELCKNQGSIQIGDSLYQCKRIHTLGEVKTKVVKVKAKCPECKPEIKRCGDDRKIFPTCESIK
jgi:hypothetical protein